MHSYNGISTIKSLGNPDTVVIGRGTLGVPAVIHCLEQDCQQELGADHDHVHLRDNAHKYHENNDHLETQGQTALFFHLQ